jgi:NDP-sugar pyrophosphorylase family protein
MRAIILAGGKGTRLRPYTVVLPKPLMPIGEYPILEVIVRQLVHQGFTHITMAVNHQAEIIQAFFGDGMRWGITIDYSLEDIPLGTMGPLRLIADLPENFLVMNGDILTDLHFSRFLQDHVQGGAEFTIASYQREVRSEYGVLEIGDDLRLTRFHEKPVSYCDVSMGVYAINRSIISRIPENTPYGFDHLMLNLIELQKPAAVRRFQGYWLDIGRPDDYETAISMFEQHRDLFLKEPN